MQISLRSNLQHIIQNVMIEIDYFTWFMKFSFLTNKFELYSISKEVINFQLNEK